MLLKETEKIELIAYLSMNPCSGALIKGAGGIRKLRWARSGSGKRGGVRVIYYFHDAQMPLYLLTIFGKNEQANLSKEEKNSLSRFVKQLARYWSDKP